MCVGGVWVGVGGCEAGNVILDIFLQKGMQPVNINYTEWMLCLN